MLEYASVVWDPHQQHTADFCPTSSATEMVAKLELERLKQRNTEDRVCMVHKIKQGLVNISVPPSLLRQSSYSSRGHNSMLHIPHTRTDI